MTIQGKMTKYRKFAGKVSTNGRVVIDATTRKELEISQGDQVEILVRKVANEVIV